MRLCVNLKKMKKKIAPFALFCRAHGKFKTCFRCYDLGSNQGIRYRVPSFISPPRMLNLLAVKLLV